MCPWRRAETASHQHQTVRDMLISVRGRRAPALDPTLTPWSQSVWPRGLRALRRRRVARHARHVLHPWHGAHAARLARLRLRHRHIAAAGAPPGRRLARLGRLGHLTRRLCLRGGRLRSAHHRSGGGRGSGRLSGGPAHHRTGQGGRRRQSGSESEGNGCFPHGFVSPCRGLRLGREHHSHVRRRYHTTWRAATRTGQGATGHPCPRSSPAPLPIEARRVERDLDPLVAWGEVPDRSVARDIDTCR